MTMENFSKSMKYTRAAGEGADVIQEEDSRADLYKVGAAPCWNQDSYKN